MDDSPRRQALQHQYTSCRKGRGAGPGFQTRSQSEALAAADRVEIERRGVYFAPRDLGQEPGSEEIDQNFPRAFRYCLLESGRWALIHSCYAGSDYSGRWGNYFAHALIGEGDDPLPGWPIDFYEWTGWKRRLELDEDTDVLPAPLAAVDMAGIPLAESFTFDELREFLREEPGRRLDLEAMIRALFQHRQSSRALVVRDSFLNGLFWTACIQKALPIGYARQISFSTYQFDDRQCAGVNMTTEGTEFLFDETEREYRFFMFDCIRGAASTVPPVCADYAAAIADWMTNDPRQIEEFYRFSSLFTQADFSPELETMFHLFELSLSRTTALNTAHCESMLQFVDRYSTTEGRTTLLPVMVDLGSTIAGQGTAAEYASVIRFLTNAAATSGSPQHRRLAFTIWCAMFDDLTITRRRDQAEVRAVYNTMIPALGGFESELAEVFLAPEHIRLLTTHYASLSGEERGAVLKDVCRFLRALGRLPVHQQAESRLLMSAAFSSADDNPSAVRGILQAFGGDEASFVEICRFLAESSDSPEQGKMVGRGLSGALAGKPESFAHAVRDRLDNVNALEILLGEWLEVADRSEDKPEAFRRYCNNIMRRLPNYQKKYMVEVAQGLAQSSSPSSRCSLAMRWLEGKEIQPAPDSFFKVCVAWVNDGLTLDPKDASAGKLAERLVEWAQKWDVELRPNRAVLRDAIRRTHLRDAGLAEDSLRRLPRALEGIDQPGYKIFLAYFLPQALRNADNDPSRHRSVLLSAYVARFAGVVQGAYLEFLNLPSKPSFGKTDLAALLVWLSFDSEEDAGASPRALKNPALQILRRKIETMSEGELRGLNQIVSNNFGGIENAPSEWRLLLETVVENQPSLLGWAKRFISGRR